MGWSGARTATVPVTGSPTWTGTSRRRPSTIVRPPGQWRSMSRSPSSVTTTISAAWAASATSTGIALSGRLRLAA